MPTESHGERDESAPHDGEDRIRAIPRDPESVFLYWDLDGPRSAEVIREVGPRCEWVLRALNLSDGTSRSIPVEPEAGNYYLEVAPGQTYGFELAVKAAGKWRTICRTERVQMPPGKPARAGAAAGSEAERGVRPKPGLNRVRAAARGIGVPGLDFDSTDLRVGSSPRHRQRAPRA